jgi:hypothetical protein
MGAAHDGGRCRRKRAGVVCSVLPKDGLAMGALFLVCGLRVRGVECGGWEA